MLCVTACSSKGSTTETSPHTQQQETVSESETSSEETIPTEAEELQETADEEENALPEDQDESDTDITLINSYTTYMNRVAAVTCPTFTFSYPDNWKITSEDYMTGNPTVSEEVILTSGSGAQILYMAHAGMGYSGRDMMRGEIVKVAESQFDPFYPNGTDRDMSYLAPFVVAELRATGILSMGIDEDYADISDRPYICYGVIPEAMLGDFTDVVGDTGLIDLLSFEYPSLYTFLAQPPEDGWSDAEREEVIAILSSFRPNGE